MQKILPIKFSSVFCFLFFFSLFAYSNENIIIKGNKNIPAETIFSFFPKKVDSLDINQLNELQKNIFKTGYFSEVSLLKKKEKIHIAVKENPFVNFFFIDGIKNQSVLSKIYEISSIKENRSFQFNLIKNDLSEVTDYLKTLGYFNAKINYNIKEIENNRLNIFYDIDLNKKFKINRIYFIGDKYFKSSVLSDVVASSEYGWWKFFSSTHNPSSELVSLDLIKLKNFYLNNGFYDAQISSHSINLLDNELVDITYSINSGKKYFFDNVNLLNQSTTLNKNDLKNLNLIILKFKNEIFVKKNLDFALEKIVKYFVRNNYNLDVNYKLMKNKTNTLNVDFIVNENPEKKIFGKILIKGNTITEDFVIRNKLNFAEGDPYNLSKINKSIDLIKGTDFFSKTTYEIQNETDNNEVNLVILVEEKPTGEIGAAAGAGTSGATIGGFLNEKNFLGRGVALNSQLSVGTQKILGKLSFSNPDFKNSGNILNGSVFAEDNTLENSGYENKIIGTSVSSSFEVLDQIFFSPGIRIDLDSLQANSNASNLIKKREGDYFTSLLFYNFNKNTKNRQYNPTDGYNIGFGQGLSFFSDIPYLKNNIYGSYYNNFHDGFVGSIKYEIANIYGFDDDIKFSDRLHANPNNLRGFSQRGIGPKLDGDFIGGNYLYSTSISSTIPNGLPDKWNAITNVFFDIANVWGVDDNSTENSNQLRSAIGLGLSWVSPLGPISVTYAEPITKKNTDDVEQFNFKIGSAF